jgi:Domain of unknown function (DUF397)
MMKYLLSIAKIASSAIFAIFAYVTMLIAVVTWTKSSLSHANGNCVEIADIEGGQVGMRDSKNIVGPVLGISREEWRAFLGGIRNGEFDKFSS